MKVLVIEDEFISRVKLQKILSRYGECHIAVNGEEMMAAFVQAHEENEPYDLLTVDIRLPDITGQEIVRRIRDWEKSHHVVDEDKEVKILMVTAMSDGKNIMASFKEGCEGYVVKPFDFNKIADALARMGIHPPYR
ncbi:MAG: response regulator [Acidobacteriota bacterium]|nr:response regulator [Acidobacteriota bacterium]